MEYIQVDSRGCGAGKTRNTIVPRIRQNIRNRIKTLVVVPSIQLQEEYSKHFYYEDFTIINSDHRNHNNAKVKISDQYQLANTPVVCMTHEGFLRTPGLEKANWELIIDEAFMPFGQMDFTNFDSKGRIAIDYGQYCTWKDYEEMALITERPRVKYQPFFELTFDHSIPADTVNKDIWRKLTNENFRLWATWENGTNFMRGAQKRTVLQLDVNPELLKGWSSVWIAAAAFEKTFMAYWLKNNGLNYEVIYEFKRHNAPIVWHIPDGNNIFNWSKTCRDNNPEVDQLFRDYCEANKTGRLIYNNNNDSNVVFIFGDRLKHNAHGINAYKDRTDYAWASAIKPTPVYKNFIIEHCGFDHKECYSEHGTDSYKFEFGFAGYMAYQLVMRTALRDPENTTPVNLFFIDSKQALGIMDLFDPKCYEVKNIEEIKVKKKESTRKEKPIKEKKIAMTSAERQKLYRENKKKKQSTSS